MKSAKQKFYDANDQGERIEHSSKGLMYISSPKEIAEIIQGVPEGRVTTVPEIVETLKTRHAVDFTCPLTTGIFISVIANYAVEEGVDIPYWRVVKKGGVLYDHYFKLPSDQADRLRAEGWEVVPRGKKGNLAIEERSR